MQIITLLSFAALFLIVLQLLDKHFVKEANEAAQKATRFYTDHNPIL